MPDFAQSIRRSPATPRPDLPSAAAGPQLVPICASLLEVLDDLRRLDERLGAIVAPLPEPNCEFSPETEIRGTVEVLRTDVLSDAISTLEFAARGDVAALRSGFDRRIAWLEAEGE